MKFSLLISYSEFHSVLIGARTFDEQFGNLRQEQWLWRSFAFSNDGVHFVDISDRDTLQRWRVERIKGEIVEMMLH